MRLKSAVALIALAASASCAPPPPLQALDGSLESVRSAFNEGAETTRVVALLSPT